MVTNEQDVAARREKDKLRKRAERSAARAIKKAATEGEFSQEAFWEANRLKLEPEQLHTYPERENAVMELVVSIRGYIDGTLEVLDDEDRGWLDETIAQVQAEVQQYGTVDVDKALFSFFTFEGVSRFNEATYNALVSRGDATAAFAQYGFLTALPISRLREWESFLRQFKSSQAAQSAQSVEMVILRCETPGCIDRGTATPKSIAERYRELKIKYQCANCLAAEKNSRVQANIRIGGETIVDGRGRAPVDVGDIQLDHILGRTR